MIIELIQIYDFFVNSRPHFLMFHLILFLIAHSLRKFWSRKYKIKTIIEFSPKDTSLIAPVYKENPKDFEEVLKRAKANNPKEILICIDGFFFSWDNVPGNDSNRLKKSLKNFFGIGWAENAEIRKSSDYKTIDIFKDGNSAEIIIDEKEEKALLNINDNITYELIVKKDNGKLEIYDFLTFELLKIANKYGKVIKGENEGKIGALAKSIRKSDKDSKFIAFLDSDTFLLDNRTLAITLTGFYNQKIVGVMGEHAINSPEGITGCFSQINELSRNVVESGLATDCCLSVVDGRFTVWRRDFLFKVVDEFYDSKNKIADDALLTFLAYKYGYESYWVKGSKISTMAQPTLVKFFKQQTRWARSGYLFYWDYMKLQISCKNKFLQTAYLLEPFSFLLSLFFDIFIFNPLPFFPVIVLPIFIVLGMLLYTILSQVILFNRPICLKYILPLSLIGFCVLFPIKIYSAFTGKAEIWGTKE